MPSAAAAVGRLVHYVHDQELVGRPTEWSRACMGAMYALQNDKALTKPAAWTAAVF